MKEVKIEDDLNSFNDKFYFIKNNSLVTIIIKCYIDLKYFLLSFVIFLILSLPIINYFNNKNIIDFTPFIQYITDCKNSVLYQREKIYNKQPYISVCIPAFNMEEYIKRNIISILNQSFQDFEIIIVNDASEDQTEDIIFKIQIKDKRIKLLSHTKKLGVYRSRIEGIHNSKGLYILLMDPDDMYLNENLFKDLFEYNINNNIDIIEFSVLQTIEGKEIIYNPRYHTRTHYHHFNKEIIYQPELSNILYYLPGTKELSKTICRNIWNKLIRREILIQMNDYIGKEYYNEYIVTADDMLMNIISYQFAKNYSNIFLPGYLYNIRNISMSRGGNDQLKEIRAKNYIHYLKQFYKCIKDYNKDINYLFHEMKDVVSNKLLIIKDNNMLNEIKILCFLIDEILKENKLSNQFVNFLLNLSTYFKN